jgi:hypothetical protein
MCRWRGVSYWRGVIRWVVEGGVDAMDSLVAKLRHVPTPDGRTPAEIEAARASPRFIPLVELMG